MKPKGLTPQQQAMAEEIEDLLTTNLRAEVKTIAQLLASKDIHELFGETEFQLWDLLMNFGAQSLEAALEARKKDDEGSSMTFPKSPPRSLGEIFVPLLAIGQTAILALILGIGNFPWTPPASTFGGRDLWGRIQSVAFVS